MSYLRGDENQGSVIFDGRDQYSEYIKQYDDWFLSTKTNVDSHLINLWQQRGLYGKVDLLGVPIAVKPYNLTVIPAPEDEPIQMALNFVTDAFIDMTRNFKTLTTKHGVLTSNFWDFKIKNSWRDPDVYYQNYRTLWEFNFWEWLLLQPPIKNEKDFITQFLFFHEYGTDSVYTYEGWMESPYASPYMTGLILEISEEEFKDDLAKLQKFFDKNVYDIFFESARRFGFLVDQNAPWRLVADIDSKAMQFYMRRNFDFEVMMGEYKVSQKMEDFIRNFDDFVYDYSHPVANIEAAKRIPTDVILEIFYKHTYSISYDHILDQDQEEGSMSLLRTRFHDLYGRYLKVVKQCPNPPQLVNFDPMQVYAQMRFRERRRTDNLKQFLDTVKKKSLVLDKTDVLNYINLHVHYAGS